MQLLSPKEEQIMYAIWEIGHPCTISDITKSHPEIKLNTAKKFLLILEEKQYLTVNSIVKTVTRPGRAYAPTISQRQYDQQKQLIGNLVESPNVSSGIMNYCSCLANEKNLNQDILNTLENIINQIIQEN